LVLSDHKNLKYHTEPCRLRDRIARWNNERQDYNVKIIYKPGSTNRADTLSRQPDYAPDTSNDNPVIALPEDLFASLNIPTIEVFHPL
jgi:hypothetical protein